MKAIESKVWQHISGRTASIYGACPWSGRDGDTRTDWSLTSRGWTIQRDDGTVGSGRKPFATRTEAEEYIVQLQQANRIR